MQRKSLRCETSLIIEAQHSVSALFREKAFPHLEPLTSQGAAGAGSTSTLWRFQIVISALLPVRSQDVIIIIIIVIIIIIRVL